MSGNAEVKGNSKLQENKCLSSWEDMCQDISTRHIPIYIQDIYQDISKDISKTQPKIYRTSKIFDLIGKWLIRHKDNQSGLDDQKHDISDCFAEEQRQPI